MASEPTIHSLYEKPTGTWQYIVSDPVSTDAVIIDAVLDCDPSTQTVSTTTADSLLSFASEKGFTITHILETHAHADHLTAASYIQSQLQQRQSLKPPICIGRRITQVQERFGARYGIPEAERDAKAFDRLLGDDEELKVGDMVIKIMHLPGHTPDHLGYVIGENVFCGDSIFHADIGTARADFPGGSATDLYKSAQKLLALPDNFKIWPGHDYPPAGREAEPSLTVAEHKKSNKHLANGATMESFVNMREERDQALAAPKLLHPSLQINIRGGKLPEMTASGQRLLHLPLTLKGEVW